MLHTWAAGDCSAQEPYNGDFAAAMKGIKAKTLVLPSQTDLYFREFSGYGSQSLSNKALTAPEDSEIEVKNMTPGVGELQVFPSIWGHWAGGEPTLLSERLGQAHFADVTSSQAQDRVLRM